MRNVTTATTTWWHAPSTGKKSHSHCSFSSSATYRQRCCVPACVCVCVVHHVATQAWVMLFYGWGCDQSLSAGHWVIRHSRLILLSSITPHPSIILSLSLSHLLLLSMLLPSDFPTHPSLPYRYTPPLSLSITVSLTFPSPLFPPLLPSPPVPLLHLLRSSSFPPVSHQRWNAVLLFLKSFLC